MKEFHFDTGGVDKGNTSNKKGSPDNTLLSRRNFMKIGALTSAATLLKDSETLSDISDIVLRSGEKVRSFFDPTKEQLGISRREIDVIGKTFTEQVASQDQITLDEKTRKAIYAYWYKEYIPGNPDNSYEKGLVTGLERMKPWISDIREQFRAHGVPEKFLYIAIAESHFAFGAISDQQAVGPYQITPDTAQRYDMILNESYDERRDPVKSARLCAAHLRHSYEHFGNNWDMALLDYNGGFTNLYREALIEKERTAPIQVRDERHMISENENLSTIARTYKTSVTLLMRANKLESGKEKELQINDELLIPQEREEITFEKFNAWLEDLINRKIAEDLTAPDYVVKDGDTIGEIAQEYNTSAEILKAINNLSSDTITPGMPLSIPTFAQEHRTQRILKTLSKFKENINYPEKFYAIHDVIFEQELEKMFTSSERTYKLVDAPKMNPVKLQHKIKPRETVSHIIDAMHAAIKKAHPAFDQSKAFMKKALLHQNPRSIPVEHMVRSGDIVTLTIAVKKPATLSDLAQKYGTTIDALQELNPAVLAAHIPLPQSIKIRIPR
jgi:LysM repeat protein